MTKVSTEWELDTNILTVLDGVIDKQAKVNSGFGKAKNEDPLAESAKRASTLNKELSTVVGTYSRMQKTVKGLAYEKQALVKLQQDLIDKESKFRKAARYDEYERELKKVRDRLKEINGELKEAPKQTEKVGTGFGKLGGTIKAALTISGIYLFIEGLVSIGNKIVEITGQSQGFENRFTRVFNGNRQAAKAYTEQLQDLANRSNFTLTELADNAAKLGARGSVQTAKEMEKIGDVANFLQKDMEQLTEAMLDATNSERWQELGIKVTKNGDKMTVSYGNFSKTVDATTAGAVEAIQAMSDLAEVQGATAEAGATLTGKVSTLGDAFDGFLRKIGTGSKDTFGFIIDGLSSILNFATELVPILGEGTSGLGSAFVGLFKSIGYALDSMNLFENELGNTATAAETTGFYINKYLILPITLAVTFVAQLITALGVLANTLKLTFSALTFDSEGFNKYFSEFNKGINRIAKLQKEGETAYQMGTDPKKFAERRKLEREQDAKDRLDREKQLQKEMDALKNKPKKTLPKSEAEKNKEKKTAQSLLNELLQAEAAYEKSLEKLQTDSRKKLLDQFDKDSQEYLDAKKASDLEEIRLEEEKFLQLKQLAKGKAFLNAKTGKYDVRADTSVTLNADEKKLFDERRTVIDANYNKDSALGTVNQQIELAGLQDQTLDANRVKLERLKWEKILLEAKEGSEKYKTLIEERDRQLLQLTNEIEKKYTLTKPLARLESEQADKENALTSDLLAQRAAGKIKQIDFEKELEKQRLAVQIEYAQKRLDLLKAFSDQNDEQVKKEIADTQDKINQLKIQGQNLKDESEKFSSFYDLMGKSLGFKDGEIEDFQNKAEFFKDAIGGIFEYEQEIAEKRVAQYDRLIDAKKKQLDKELEFQKQGLANNAGLRAQELAQLEKDRKKAITQAKIFQTATSAIESIEQATSLVTSAANIFKFSSKLGPIGLGIAAGSIALLLTLFKSFKNKAASEVTPIEYGEGGELDGLPHSRGGMRIEGSNVFVEGGEYITKKRQTKKYKSLLEAVNDDRLKHMTPFQIFKLIGGDWSGLTKSAFAGLASPMSDPKQERFYSEFGRFMDIAGAYYEEAPTETGTQLAPGIIEYKSKSGTRIVRHTALITA